MLIGALVARTGLSRDTIRFYEKEGLISVTRKERRNNNYKEYSEAVLERLLTIKRLKNFGFTLKESAEVLSMIETNEATCDNVREMIHRKIGLLDARIKDMLVLRNQLINGVKKCCSPSGPRENCRIIISDNSL
ncbi:MerR family transcriptional regulator [Niabella beijingensis]|uniref:MerR family transcriptional regulator n=1 Tax=Niabella beijingensis TaxID=2872700 RepID=UPI001CBCA989|nr:MerR family transcriptional regulator [Niabella beijingensis]MBZ4192544.1 MerR family transcriptional regulator [Niabella beijingensis]